VDTAGKSGTNGGQKSGKKEVECGGGDGTNGLKSRKTKYESWGYQGDREKGTKGISDQGARPTKQGVNRKKEEKGERGRDRPGGRGQVPLGSTRGRGV